MAKVLASATVVFSFGGSSGADEQSSGSTTSFGQDLWNGAASGEIGPFSFGDDLNDGLIDLGGSDGWFF